MMSPTRLHIPVLDPIVDHLGVVPGPKATKVASTQTVFNLDRALGDDRLDHVVGDPGATGHEAGPVARVLLRVGDEDRIGRLE